MKLSVATTSEYSMMPLYEVTHDKSTTELITPYPAAQMDIDQDTLLVATKTTLADEILLLQQQEKTPLSTDKKAAKRTSLPHLWEHIDPELELTVATQSQDTEDSSEQCPKSDMDITRIIRVATDVLCSLEADLQNHSIERPLNLGNSVFPEPIVNIEDGTQPSIDTQTSNNNSEEDMLGKYYEVLYPEGNDIMHISHSDIMRNKCSVCAKLLFECDIALWTKPVFNGNEDATSRPRPKYSNMDTLPESSSSSDGDDTIAQH